MRKRTYFVAGFFAVVYGAGLGLVADQLNPNLKTMFSQSVDPEKEIACLQEALYYEGRGALPGERTMQGMVILARVKDPDRQWPKTICGVVHQPGQFSYWSDKKLMSARRDVIAWKLMELEARDLIRDAWKKQFLPHGAGCVRSYKLRDVLLASLKPIRLEQLHVSEKSLGFFPRTQVPVFEVGSHTFYQNKSGCKHPLPTT